MTIFWISLFAVFYAYFGYPIILSVLGRIVPAPVLQPDNEFSPGVSILIPVHNERDVIEAKLENTEKLDYPPSNLEVLFISDGSTDGTNDIIASHTSDVVKLIPIDERKGKANALNVGLQEAQHDIIVFSDASILLDENAIREIVRPFYDKTIGCVSGEDHIKDSGGESAYGQYELWLRNLESRIHSVVGASGSFYAQRRVLCESFGEGLAPDFLSVLNTVEKGYRAVTEPRAFGYMTSVKNTSDEFNRKIRTLIRGMSALFYKKNMLNISKYGTFSFALFSHKLMRWLVPFFLIALYISNIAIATEPFYGIFILLQTAFYLLAWLSYKETGTLHNSIYGKIALYFTMVNLSILIAWKRYWGGVRQEVWDPSKRTH